MADFLWREWNIQKIDHHALSTDEVEFAWSHRRDVARKHNPEYGEYYESIGRCPSGRIIKIVWRYNKDEFDNESVFVITAYGRWS